jgi:integrase/recombinase XerD
VQFLVAKYAAEAASRCPSIAAKQVTPHVLRHTCVIYGGSLSIRHVRAA